MCCCCVAPSTEKWCTRKNGQRHVFLLGNLRIFPPPNGNIDEEVIIVIISGMWLPLCALQRVQQSSPFRKPEQQNQFGISVGILFMRSKQKPDITKRSTDHTDLLNYCHFFMRFKVNYSFTMNLIGQCSFTIYCTVASSYWRCSGSLPWWWQQPPSI